MNSKSAADTMNAMREYKLTLIIQDALAKKEAELKKHLEGLLAVAKGKVVKTNTLGSRTLAYPIDGLSSGSYVFLTIEADETKAAGLEKSLKLDEQIIRYLLVRN